MSKTVSDLANNPLVNPPQQPFNAPPFGFVRPEHFKPAVDYLLGQARKNIAAIVNNPEPPTFENTIHALAFADEDLIVPIGVMNTMTNSINEGGVQEAWTSILPALSAFSTEVSLNKHLFQRIETVYKTADRTQLTEEQNTLLENTYTGYKLGGALLKGKKRTQYAQLNDRLSSLTNAFDSNLNSADKILKIVIPLEDAHRLAGLPETAIAKFRENAVNDPDAPDDGWVITTTPLPLKVLDFADDRTLRKDVMKLLIEKRGRVEDPTKGKSYFNHGNVLETLENRQKFAELLGFANHAEKKIRPDTRMIQSPENALNFLKKSAEIYRPVAIAFYEELCEYARRVDGIEKLERWDIGYYRNKLREEQIGYNPKDAKPYFELDAVLNGLFENSRIVHGVEVRPAPEGKYGVYHEDVRPYELCDKDGNVTGLLYIDPYARPGKRGGAWMENLRDSGLYRGEQALPVATVNCNFQKPAKGQPALLEDPHNDISTLYHEWGHTMDGLGRRGTYPSVAGMKGTFWDTIEYPSQFNENFAFKPKALKEYARHYKTGEAIPDDLIEKFQKLEQFEWKWAGLRQTEFGLLDMAYHTTNPAEIKDLKTFEDSVLAPYRVIPEGDEPPKILNFGHLFGGYDAGYYSYMNALVIACNVHAILEERNMDPEACAAFMEHTIRPGGIKNPLTQYYNFRAALGLDKRDPDPEVMLRQQGFLPQQQATVLTPPSGP